MDLSDLQLMFPSVGRDVVAAVFTECKNSVEAAVDKLLDLTYQEELRSTSTQREASHLKATNLRPQMSEPSLTSWMLPPEGQYHPESTAGHQYGLFSPAYRRDNVQSSNNHSPYWPGHTNPRPDSNTFDRVGSWPVLPTVEHGYNHPLEPIPMNHFHQPINPSQYTPQWRMTPPLPPPPPRDMRQVHGSHPSEHAQNRPTNHRYGPRAPIPRLQNQYLETHGRVEHVREDPKCNRSVSPPRGIQKKLIILRGLPGSGKTTLARNIKGKMGVVCSTDDFFVVNTKYVFEPELLSEYHMKNRHKAQQAMNEGRSPVIIDNTNSSSWEMKPYVSLAIDFGYNVEIVEPDTPWRFKVAELAKRNIHGVPRASIERMLENYEHKTSLEQILNSLPPGKHPAAEDGKNKSFSQEPVKLPPKRHHDSQQAANHKPSPTLKKVKEKHQQEKQNDTSQETNSERTHEKTSSKQGGKGKVKSVKNSTDNSTQANNNGTKVIETTSKGDSRQGKKSTLEVSKQKTLAGQGNNQQSLPGKKSKDLSTNRKDEGKPTSNSHKKPNSVSTPKKTAMSQSSAFSSQQNLETDSRLNLVDIHPVNIPSVSEIEANLLAEQWDSSEETELLDDETLALKDFNNSSLPMTSAEKTSIPTDRSKPVRPNHEVNNLKEVLREPMQVNDYPLKSRPQSVGHAETQVAEFELSLKSTPCNAPVSAEAIDVSTGNCGSWSDYFNDHNVPTMSTSRMLGLISNSKFFKQGEFEDNLSLQPALSDMEEPSFVPIMPSANIDSRTEVGLSVTDNHSFSKRPLTMLEAAFDDCESWETSYLEEAARDELKSPLQLFTTELPLGEWTQLLSDSFPAGDDINYFPLAATAAGNNGVSCTLLNDVAGTSLVSHMINQLPLKQSSDEADYQPKLVDDFNSNRILSPHTNVNIWPLDSEISEMEMESSAVFSSGHQLRQVTPTLSVSVMSGELFEQYPPGLSFKQNSPGGLSFKQSPGELSFEQGLPGGLSFEQGALGGLSFEQGPPLSTHQLDVNETVDVKGLSSIDVLLGTAHIETNTADNFNGHSVAAGRQDNTSCDSQTDLQSANHGTNYNSSQNKIQLLEESSSKHSELTESDQLITSDSFQDFKDSSEHGVDSSVILKSDLSPPSERISISDSLDSFFSQEEQSELLSGSGVSFNKSLENVTSLSSETDQSFDLFPPAFPAIECDQLQLVENLSECVDFSNTAPPHCPVVIETPARNTCSPCLSEEDEGITFAARDEDHLLAVQHVRRRSVECDLKQKSLESLETVCDVSLLTQTQEMKTESLGEDISDAVKTSALSESESLSMNLFDNERLDVSDPELKVMLETSKEYQDICNQSKQESDLMFLGSCFPDLEPGYLHQLLTKCDNNVEDALSIALVSMTTPVQLERGYVSNSHFHKTQKLKHKMEDDSFMVESSDQVSSKTEDGVLSVQQSEYGHSTLKNLEFENEFREQELCLNDEILARVLQEQLDLEVSSTDSSIPSDIASGGAMSNESKDTHGHQLDDDNLVLTLSSSFASQLQALFGSVEEHLSHQDGLSEGDLKVLLSEKVARGIHQKWMDTLKAKQIEYQFNARLLIQKDESLAMDLHNREKQTNNIRSKRQRYVSEPCSPPYTNQTMMSSSQTHVSGQHPLAVSHNSLTNVMDEQLALEIRNKELTDVVESVVRPNLSMQIQLNQLCANFPTVDKFTLYAVLFRADFKFEEAAKQLETMVSGTLCPSGSENAEIRRSLTSPAALSTQSHRAETGMERGVVSYIQKSAGDSGNKSNSSKESTSSYQSLQNQPSYQSLQNQSSYQSLQKQPSYNELRAEAALHAKLRAENFQQAAKARGQKMWQVAQFYAQKGHLHTQEMNEANRRAATAQIQSSDMPGQLDLHGLHVDEAKEALMEKLIKETKDRSELIVITGRGLHSDRQVARIKPAVVSLLRQKNYRFEEVNAGMLKVFLKTH